MKAIQRNEAIDIIRIFAAFGVIAIHVAVSTPGAMAMSNFFTIFCVPFFYVVSLTYFITSIKSTSTVSEIFSKLWWRMVVPYLAWTVIYIALLLMKKQIAGKHETFIYWKAVFYGNTAVQLYFLPQLIMMQLLLISFFLLKSPSVKKIILSLGLMALVVCYLWIGYSSDCFGMTSVSSIVTYIVGALWLASIIRSNRISITTLIVGCLIVVACILREFLAMPFYLPPVIRFLPIGGIGLVLIAINLQINKLPKFISILSSVSFGIYLCHILFLESFELILSRIWKGGLYYNFISKAAVAMAIFIASAIFTLLLNKFTVTKQLFLGKRI